MEAWEQRRYPIGLFEPDPAIGMAGLRSVIEEIPEIAVELRAGLSVLAPDQLRIPYRPGGWNVRQIVHHLAQIREFVERINRKERPS